MGSSASTIVMPHDGFERVLGQDEERENAAGTLATHLLLKGLAARGGWPAPEYIN